MTLALIGVNYKTAPIAVREQIAISRADLAETTRALAATPGVTECMIVSTCNRVELLAAVETEDVDLTGFLHRHFGLDPALLEPHIYQRRDRDAVRHLFRVAASLDSMVVGEPQILGQVKEAFAVARASGTVAGQLEHLLQSAFAAAKDSVTIGGIVTQARKIRTRSGTDMTFATLDDLEGQAELIVFETALESLGRPLEADMIVLVRGRVDHKDGETSVVAQSIELFQPDPEEVERARVAAREAARPKKLHLALSGEHGRAELLSDLKHVLAAFPGTAEVVVELGETRIRLGEGYRVEPSVSLRAELEQLTGAPARLVA